jgi:hypothetical protein
MSAIERLRLRREAAELTAKAMEVAENPQEREGLLAEARRLTEEADRAPCRSTTTPCLSRLPPSPE